MGFKVYLQVIIAEVNHKNKSDVRKNFIGVCLHTRILTQRQELRCRRKWGHVANIHNSSDIHRDYTVGMEGNTNLRKTENNALCAEVGIFIV